MSITPAALITRAPSVARPARPVVIAHRGASGYRPEHTLAAYELGARLGADFIEPDLVATRDGVLVARHEPEIGMTTDVASRPEFADRYATRLVDGEAVTGWFTDDFTLAELKTLRVRERIPHLRQANTMWDGRFEIATFDEILDLRARLSLELGREIGVYPETKNPTYFRERGLALEPLLVDAVRRHGLDAPTAPLFVQSFELGTLESLRREHALTAPLVLLAEEGAPYDLVASGDRRTYADLLTPTALAALAGTIDAIGVDKSLVIERREDGSLASAPTRLVEDAHAAGLLVHAFTFRAENVFLPTEHRVGAAEADRGRALDELVRFLRAGVDGVFADQADVAVAARTDVLADLGGGESHPAPVLTALPGLPTGALLIPV